MEHRCNQRKPMSINVVLNYRNLGLVTGRTRNLSLGGMFIDIGVIKLSRNAVVELSFPVACGSGTQQCKAKALVVHHGSDGVGLMFCEMDSKVRQMLRMVLFGYATVSQRAYQTSYGTQQADSVTRAIS
ncbi:PilZ domain-containing protein [Candidatus Endoriftia persephone]|uniref:PilZ domain-containing protein n=1 Tax=Candidatus Endoriftia persephonae TaxID=393765 RepID=A0A9J6ZUF2_9GAMM|nr:PilZ domain-containing protein [Candidatus Endoriftia persephone]USF86346.1 PilZ domain-containing protein [Candidatus Endoriftia persephone]